MDIFKTAIINSLVGVIFSFVFSALTAVCIVIYLSPLNLIMDVLTDPRLHNLVFNASLQNLYILPLCFVVIGLFTGQSVITTALKSKEKHENN